MDFDKALVEDMKNEIAKRDDDKLKNLDFIKNDKKALITRKKDKDHENPTVFNIYVVWVSGKEGEGEYREYYEDGQIRETSFYKNGELHGTVKRYEHTGHMYYEGSYKNGKRHGRSIIHSSDGTIQRLLDYKDGKKHGHDIGANKGKIYRHVLCKDGRRLKWIDDDKGTKIKDPSSYTIDF